MSSYKQDLEEKYKEKEIRINVLVKELEGEKDNKKWFDTCTELNAERMNLATIRSRIANIGKTAYIPERYQVIL